MSVAQNKAVSRRWYEAWGTDAIETACAECLAADFVAHFSGQGTLDRATYIRLDREFAAAFRDSRIMVDELIGENDTIATRMRWCAMHTGKILGVAPTGKRFEIAGFAMDRFRGGRVIEHFPLFDQLSMLQQLGVVERPPHA